MSISPVTSAAIGEFDLPIAAEAGEFTTEGVLAALIGPAGDEGTSPPLWPCFWTFSARMLS